MQLSTTGDSGPPSRLVVAAVLALLALWLPLPFGSVLPWAVVLLELAALALVLAVLLLARRESRRGPTRLPAAMLILVAIFGLVQTVPLPRAVVHLLSPARVELADDFARTAAAPVSGSIALTLAAPPTISAATAFAAMAALLVAAGWVGRRRQPRRIVAAAVVAAGLFQVLYGGARWMTGSSTIWEVTVPGSSGRLRGTFVNPDHAAAFLELALVVAFAWGWWALRRAREARAWEWRLLWVAPPAMAWLTLFAGLAFTASRGGMIAAVTAAVVQGVLVGVARRRGRLAIAGVLVALVGLGVVGAIGAQEAFGRWLATSRFDVSWQDRLTTYRATLALWQRFPLTGTGLGTFKEAYPLVQPHGQGGTWGHTHNDFLEPLATAGAVGAAALLLAVASGVSVLSRRLQIGLRTEDRAAALAALGAVASLGVHSFFDFGLSIPAIAATLVIVVGLGLGVPLPTNHSRSAVATGPTEEHPRRPSDPSNASH